MDTVVKLHICNITRLGNQINDKNTVTQNILFDILNQRNTARGHPRH